MTARTRSKPRRVFLHPLWLLLLIPVIVTHVAWVNEPGTWTWQRIGYWSYLCGERTGRVCFTPVSPWVLVNESEDGTALWQFDHGLTALDIAVVSGDTLGTIDLIFGDETHGVFAPTSRTLVVGLDYWTGRSGPGLPTASFSESELDELVEELRVWCDPGDGTFSDDSLHAPLSKHRAWFREIELVRTRLWSGYVHNTVFVIATVWLLFTVRAVWRYKPWRDWGKAAWQCASCGYDRRGLDDDALCPECGQAASEPLTPAG